MALFFFVVLAGSVTIQGLRIQTQHRLDTVNAELEAQSELHQQLRADVATAESPERIMTEATALGLVESGQVEPLVSGTAGIVGTADIADIADTADTAGTEGTPAP